jgi:hypothetical protein
MREIRTVSINEVIPYWRNPRDNRDAIEKVKVSIQEYGYQAPIIVDGDMTIVAGHTRYRALRELGFDQIEVVVSDISAKKAKEYRIIDNRTTEYAKWDENLTLELKEFEDLEIAGLFFPNLKLDVEFQDSDFDVSLTEIRALEEELPNRLADMSERRNNEPKLNIPCPQCGNQISLLKAEVERLGNWDKE